MAHVHARRPDVLVLDLGMSSRGSGIEALDKLSREARDMRIVVLTMNDDPAFARRVLDNGALGLVLKEMADSDLPAAVREASRGKRYVSPLLAAKLNGGKQNDSDTLTPARARGAAPDRARPHERRDRQQARALTAHDRDPPRAHPSQAGSRHTRGARALRPATRAVGAVSEPWEDRPARRRGDAQLSPPRSAWQRDGRRWSFRVDCGERSACMSRWLCVGTVRTTSRAAEPDSRRLPHLLPSDCYAGDAGSWLTSRFSWLLASAGRSRRAARRMRARTVTRSQVSSSPLGADEHRDRALTCGRALRR